MRYKLVAALAALLAPVLLLPGTAQAVQFGTPDGDGHPYVGLVVLYDEAASRSGAAPARSSRPRCS